MLRRIRSKLSYANVIATIALFLALGGASYAALKLPRDSVGTKQLKNGAVTNKKLANRSVTASKIKGAVTKVFYHQNTGTLGMTDTATFHTFQSLSLPAGTFIITVKHVVQTMTNPLELDCDVVKGTTEVGNTLDSFYTELQANSALPMVGTAVATLSSPTTITDQCAEYHNVDAILTAGYMTAVQAGTAQAAANDHSGVGSPRNASASAGNGPASARTAAVAAR